MSEEKPAEKPVFPLEKVLTISLADYISFTKIDLGRYALVGVHFSDLKNREKWYKSKEEFLRRIPENTEVVVNYQCTSAGTGAKYADESYVFTDFSGTALVPKPKKRHNPPMDDEVKE